MVGGLNANQTLMLIVFLIAAGLLFWRHRIQKDEQGEPSEPPQ
jgi:hypothetical protein